MASAVPGQEVRNLSATPDCARSAVSVSISGFGSSPHLRVVQSAWQLAFLLYLEVLSAVPFSRLRRQHEARIDRGVLGFLCDFYARCT